jgi:uncharacterized membrane protein
LISFRNISRTKPYLRTVLVFILLHIAISLLFFIPLSQIFYYEPGSLELSFAKQMLSGDIPYRDFNSEYPPLALFIFYLPALIRNTNPAYSLLFAGEMMLFDLAIVYFVADIASYVKLPVMRTLATYTLLLLAVGPIMAIRFDLMPAALIVAALWAFIKGKNTLAWFILALGVTGKIYPLIVAPAFGFYLLRNRQFKTLIKGVAAFSLTMLACNLPFFLMNPAGFMSIVTYHGQRGIQCESTWASALLIDQILGGPKVMGIFDFGSWNLSSTLADRLAPLAFPLTAMLLLAMYGVFVWLLWKRTDRTRYNSDGIEPDAARFIIAYATLAIAVFMAGDKVFSPQFLIWLFPTVPLLNFKWQPAYTLLFVIMGFITQFIFPYKYYEYSLFLTPFVLIGALRNLLLIIFATLIILTNGVKTELPEYQTERALVSAGGRRMN